MDHLYEVNPGRSLILPENFGTMTERVWAVTGDYVNLENELLRGWTADQMHKLSKRRVLPKGKACVKPGAPAALRQMANHDAAKAGVEPKTEAVEKAEAKIEATVEEVVDAVEPPDISPAPEAAKPKKSKFGGK